MDFPRRAPGRGITGTPYVPIRVSLMKTAHAVFWDTRIQPVIAVTLPVAVALPVKRANDGLFFYTDKTSAVTLAAKYAGLR